MGSSSRWWCAVFLFCRQKLMPASPDSMVSCSPSSFPVPTTLFSMTTKKKYISWTSSEEIGLQKWIDKYQHLSWKERAEKYSLEVIEGRSPESLRSKYGQLHKQNTCRNICHGEGQKYSEMVTMDSIKCHLLF